MLTNEAISITTLALLSGLATGQPPSQPALFEAAGPAQMEDYPKFVDLNPSVARLTCVVLGTGEVHNPGVLQEIRIGRYDQIIPGTPSNGPLFPGAPDQVITKLSVPIIVTPNSADATNRQVEELMMRQFPSAKTALHSSGDLMTTAEYSNGALLQIAYRKNGAE